MRRSLCAAAAALLLTIVGSAALGPASAQAAISLVSASTGANSLSSSSQAINEPSGVTSGNVLVATVTATGTGTITPPAGWTQIQTTATTLRQSSYYHVAGSSEPSSWTWSLGSGRTSSGGIIAYTGVNTIAPIDASAASSGSSGNAIAPSVTTNSTGDRVIAAVSFGSTLTNSVTPDPSTTERYDTSGLLGVNVGTENEAADFTQSAAGATPTKTATPTTSSVAWIAQTIALNDASNATLSVATTAAPSFSASLPAGNQTQPYTLPLTVQDTRTGSSAATGWNLTITSTPFTSGSHTLPASASQATGVTSACAGGAVCVAPTNAIGYPLAVPSGSGPPAAVKLFNAASATGTGAFSIVPAIGVAIPANAYAGTYTSTVTISLASGP